MKVGITTPSPVRGEVLDAERYLSWATEAEKCGYASLSIIDRIIFTNPEPLIALAAIAGATSRISVLTNLLITPVRETTLLAKQAATLDILSGGRLVLGVGIGGRPEDYAAVGRPTAARGQVLEQQITALKDIWRGVPTPGGVVGPTPLTSGGPPVLVGGGPRAVKRAVELADGWIGAWPAKLDHEGPWVFSGIGDEPAPLANQIAVIHRQWGEAGRTGRPTTHAALYVVIGGEPVQQAADTFITNWYGFSDYLLPRAFSGMARTPDQLAAYLEAFERSDVDYLNICICSSHEQLLADVAHHIPDHLLN